MFSGRLYRIGRARSPLAFTPWERAGGERFDDPHGQFRVLYTGERLACFLEVLADFRLPDKERRDELTTLLNNTRNTSPKGLPSHGTVTRHWVATKRISSLSIGGDIKALDLRAHHILALLEKQPRIATTLRTHGRTELDLSDVTGPNREITQTISRWAFEQGYECILYACRFDAALTCVAVFEGVPFQGGRTSRTRCTDQDLQRVARAWNLYLPRLGLADHLKSLGHDSRRYASAFRPRLQR